MRANLLLEQGQHDAAMRDYGELIRLFPNVAEVYGCRARAWLQLGEKEKAAEDFREAVQLDPGHAEIYAIQGLLIEAAFHHNREEFAQAIAKATEAIRADGDVAPRMPSAPRPTGIPNVAWRPWTITINSSRWPNSRRWRCLAVADKSMPKWANCKVPWMT